MSMTLLFIPIITVSLLAADEATPVVLMQNDLRAAAEARARRATEDQRWNEERQRLHIVLETQRRTLNELDAEFKQVCLTRNRLQQDIAANSTSATVAARLAIGVQALSDRLHGVAERAMPGLVEWPAEQVGEDRFAALAAAVQQAENANAKYAVLTVEGELDGQRRVVRVLRVGGACGWWVSLDGTQAGSVQRHGNQIILKVDPDPATRVAIVGAMERIDGRSAPGLVMLQLPVGDEVRP